MAALPPNSLLARSRSTRAGNATRTTNATAPTGGPSSSSVVAPHSSNIQSFLTNLRLLDLDSLPDWPGFDTQTFSVQKKRIQAIEWALYQLFCLWDLDEARTKLEPFFPPRDQVQSINLRSALQRCLEQVKKNGLLGRDAVVRKTMLDECKGERLEEVLAVFSAAVLRKLVAAAADAEGEHPAIAQQLALEDRGYAGDKADLVALNLAHRASLSKILREKDAARRKYRDLSELLSLKERNIARRQEQVKSQRSASAAKHVSDDARMDMWRVVRNNWAGNEQWMETLLCGDTNARQDGVLSAPFDRVWRRVQSDRLSELEDEGKGLLERLDGRVRAQRESLRKWQDFRQHIFGDEPDVAAPAESARPANAERGINFGFDSHTRLHLGQMSPRKKLGAKQPTLASPYASMIQDLQDELKEVDVARAPSLKSLLGPRTRQPERPPPAAAEVLEEPVSEISELDDSFGDTHGEPPRPVEQSIGSSTKPVPDSRKASWDEEQPDEPYVAPVQSNVKPSVTSQYTRQTASRSHPSPEAEPEEESQSPPRPARSKFKMSIEGPPSPEPVSPTTEMADRILASMDNASPSPVKQAKPRHTLSLAERTRLSMARMSRGGKQVASPYEDEDEHMELPATPDARGSQAITPVLEDHDLALEDLASRTRRSLAGFEASRQKAQLERRRSQRRSRMAPRGEGSYFPKVEEEEDGGAANASLMAEDLDAEDMDAIFKSRPKLQTSPGPSPTRRWDADEHM